MGREGKGGKGEDREGGKGQGRGKERPNILLHPQFQFSRNMPAPPLVSEMADTVSSGTLSSSIPYDAV